MQRINTPQGRHYQTPNGTYPSVTTILEATRSQLEKDRLRKWKHKMAKIHGSDGGERVAAAARDRGTLLHNCVTSFLEKDPFTPPEQIKPYWEQAEPIVSILTKPITWEQPVWHDQHQYAGTYDLFCDWNGLPTILDWKTSNEPKRLKWLSNHQMQLAAYAKAYEWLHGCKVKQTVIIVVTPMRSQIFCFDEEEVAEHWQGWLEKLKQYREISNQLDSNQESVSTDC